MKKAKKMVTLFCVVFILCGMVSMAKAVDMSEYVPCAVLTDNRTGETKEIPLERVCEPQVMSSANGTTYSVSYNAFVPIPTSDIQPLSEIIGGKDENGVRVTITVVYEISRDHEDIKIKQIYGGWEPSSNLYIVTDREVGLYNFATGDRLRKYPTTNTFNYTTGWGYGSFIVGNTGAPYTWADAVIEIYGMTATYDLTYGFIFPDEH